MIKLVRPFLVIVLSWFCLGIAVRADEAAFDAVCERETVAALQVLAQNPKGKNFIPTNCLDAMGTYKAEFEAAFESTRRLLRDNLNNPDLRANLGMLYFLRDKVRGEALGGIERSLDQFLAALAADPRHAPTLAYLESYCFLDAYSTRLTAGQLRTLESALRRAMLPDNYPAHRALLRLIARDSNRLEEAAGVAEYLAAKDFENAQSWVLLGSVRLLQKRDAEANQAFNKALAMHPSKREEGAAMLGIAACRFLKNELRAADEAWVSAKAILPWPKALEAAVGEYGLEPPDSFSWALGKALLASGQGGRALPLVGVGGAEWLGSEDAFQQYKTGADLFCKKDYEGAHSAFLKAVQLIPLDTDYTWALATCAFDSGTRYREAIWAFRKLEKLKPFDKPVDYYKLGLSLAVTGDYSSAQKVFNDGTRKFPGDVALASWRIVMAFGVGGWEEATNVWRENHPGNNTYADRGERFNVLYDGLHTIAAKAEKQGGRYVTFAHLSLLYGLVCESARQGIYNDDGRRWVRGELKEIRAKLVQIYQELPLKPAVSSAALALEARAQDFVDAGNIEKAVENYQLAVEHAPCWPEGIYNLAVTARTGGPWLPGAIEEMKIYLDVAQDDPNASQAKAMLAEWESDLRRAMAVGGMVMEIAGGSNGEQLAMLYGADNGGSIPSPGPNIPWGPR